jgi:hypothetical protein
MQSKINVLYERQLVVVMLLILVFIISTIGCGTGQLRTYQAALLGPDSPKYRMVDWKIEHNLFNGRHQQVDLEDLNDDIEG